MTQRDSLRDPVSPSVMGHSASALGERPSALLSEAPGAPGVTLRLLRGAEGFVGVLPASSALAERLRLGLVPAVTVFGDDGTRFLCEARVTLRGRTDAAEHAPVRAMLAADPFGMRDGLVVEVLVSSMVADAERDDSATQPRT